MLIYKINAYISPVLEKYFHKTKPKDVIAENNLLLTFECTALIYEKIVCLTHMRSIFSFRNKNF
jgi:hypothetical protein